MARAYQVFRTHHAPFVVAVAAEMLADLRADVAAHPGRRVVFLGRDGHAYAAAIRALAPDFYAAAATEIVVSRVLVDAALQDLERSTGATFPELPEAFRVRERVHPSEVHGAYRALTRYLDDAGVPVATGGSVTLVDNSFKGTIQEMLAAAYPDTRFTGRYALHSAHPDDPHPASKTGYAFHQPAGPRWRGVPESQLPTEPEFTFGAADALSVLEDTLNGPDTSPRTLTGDARPVQHPLRTDPAPLRGLNPALVAPDWRDPTVREAIKTAALLAVADTADAAASLAGGTPAELRAHRHAVQQEFSTQVRAWIQHGPALDPALGELLDSFVLRADHALLATLHDTLARAGVTAAAAAPIWQQLAARTERADTAALVEDTLAALTPNPDPGPSATAASTTARTAPAGPDGIGAEPQAGRSLQQLARDWRRRRAAEDDDIVEGVNRRGTYPGNRPDPARNSLHHRS